jgi:hypothetical protein
MAKVVTITLATLLFIPCSANANPLTLACALVSPEQNSTRFDEANQFVIDPDAQSVDMRAAETMATSLPVNWLFITRKDDFFDDAFSVREGEDRIAGGGVYGGTAHIFTYDKAAGMLTWMFMALGEPAILRWRCFS